MPGCYTSMYRVKKKHALLENELFFTEKILSCAYNKGLLKEYPEEKIHEITEDLLNTEFHDVLPGSSIQCGEDNGLKLLDHGLLEAERLKTRAIFALSSNIVAYARKNQNKNEIANAIEYVNRFPTEFRNKVFSDLLRICAIVNILSFFKFQSLYSITDFLHFFA